MSYEYKDEIIMNIKDYNAGRRVVTGGINDFESKLTELDHIYAQAAKADEYADKAKSYNDTLKTLDKLINDDERYKEARSNDFIAGMLIAYENIFNLMEDYIKEGCE